MQQLIQKADLKGATGVDTSNLAAKLNLASLKVELDKMHKDKLTADLIKLRNVVDSDIHCAKCVQIRRFFWSVFSRIPTEYG